MISRHNRVGTLFFATAEFIFDDWHRFLGVVVGDRKTQEGGKRSFSSFLIIIVLLWMLWLYKWWWCARIIVLILIN